MKKITLDDLRDVAAMSRVLHLALGALQRSHMQLRAADLCKIWDLHHSELSRMGLLHRRPSYGPLVNRYTLERLLRLLFLQFQTLVLYELPNGHYRVRLYKRLEGRRLPQSALAVRRQASPFRRVVRPGTTKWFLMEEQERSGTGM